VRYPGPEFRFFFPVSVYNLFEWISVKKAVIPAEAGIQNSSKTQDSRLHGNDGERSNLEETAF
jgi:hypothetical protein